MSERTVTIKWQDPRELAAAGRELPGLEFLQKIVAGELPPPPIASLMNFTIVELREGYAVFAVEPAEYHYNPIAWSMVDWRQRCSIPQWVVRSTQRYRPVQVTQRWRSKLTSFAR